MIRSTFSGLNTALFGLMASQKALDVTGQNLTNLGTEGYTRQRLDQVSLGAPGHNFANSKNSIRVGQGVLMTGVSQIRDPFLDVQYRSQATKVGTVDAKNQILEKIGNIFDDADAKSIQNALDDIVNQLQTLSTKVGQDGMDGLVRSAFSVMLNYVHQNATDLGKISTELVEKLDKTVVPDINMTLQKITELNDSIKTSEILGNPALELKDQRNLLIDELSTYFPIEVKYTDVPISASGDTVETLQINLKNGVGGCHDPIPLIDDSKAAKLDFIQPANPGDPYEIHITESITPGGITHPKVVFSEGVLKGDLDMLNGSGIFDDPASDIKGIGYYEKLFDTFINTMATKMNAMNVPPGTDPADVDDYALFVNSDTGGTAGITAANIKISDKWQDGTITLLATTDPNGGDKAADNILRMKALLSTDSITFTGTNSSGDPVTVYTGTMPGAYTNIQGELGIEKKATVDILEAKMNVFMQAADSRDSVSGVYLDEEVMNLMKFQQSYSACSRVMTAMDEILDKLINSTGVVGR